MIDLRADLLWLKRYYTEEVWSFHALVVALIIVLIIALLLLLVTIVLHMPKFTECGAVIRLTAAPPDNPWCRTDDVAPQRLRQSAVAVSRSLVVHPCRGRHIVPPRAVPRSGLKEGCVLRDRGNT
jgi:hypothetical protein